jgi:hypothetical protein
MDAVIHSRLSICTRSHNLARDAKDLTDLVFSRLKNAAVRGGLAPVLDSLNEAAHEAWFSFYPIGSQDEPVYTAETLEEAYTRLDEVRALAYMAADQLVRDAETTGEATRGEAYALQLASNVARMAQDSAGMVLKDLAAAVAA